MKYIIDLPEEVYNTISEWDNKTLNWAEMILKNATPLPKGHGRIVDVNEVIKIANKTKDLHGAIWNAPTIIEADKEQNE